MPITKYIKGNLLDHDGPIAHGVNCQGKMRSGVAKAIREKYPQHYEDYMQVFNSGKLELGFVVDTFIPTSYKPVEGKRIFGIATQKNYGYDGKRYVNYSVLAFAFFDDMTNLIGNTKKTILGIPKIGAGLGGGDWNIIEQIINDATPNLEIWVYEL